MAEMLNIELGDWASAGRTSVLKAGHQIGKAELLFQKIEEEEIQAQLDKLKKEEEPKSNLNARQIKYRLRRLR